MPFDFSKNLITIVQIFVSLFILAQATIVLIQNPKSNVNRSFFLFQFCVFVWMMGMGSAYLIADESLALFIAKIGYIGVSSIPVTTYVFSSYLRNNKPNKILTSLGIILTATVAININNPFFVIGTVYYEWGNYMLLGPGGFVSVFLFVIFMSLFGRNLYLLYKRSERRKKWYFLAFIFGILSFVGAIDFFPGYEIFTKIHPLGFIFVSVFSSFMGYFIIRYSLSDVKLVLGRVVGHSIMIGLLVLIYVSVFITLSPGVKNLKDIFVNLFFFISAVYLFSLFSRVGRKLTDEIFYRDQIDFETKINLFEKELYRFQDPNKFFKEVFDFIEDSLRIENPLFILIDEKDKSWLLVKSIGQKIKTEKIPMLYKGVGVSDNKNALDIVDIKQISLADDITKEAILLSEQNGGVLLSSLYSRVGIVGFLVFGRQLSGQSYDFDTKKALKGLTGAISISWENVKLFENIEHENQLKMDFVSIASHQLRTPLTRLKWALELLSSKVQLEKDIKKIFNELVVSTDDMVGLVNQLLNVAESEKSEVMEKKNFKINPVLQDIINKKNIETSKKDILLKFNTEMSDIEAMFSVNSLKIIFETLIDNAIQYTPNGGEIDVDIKGSNDNMIEIKISDNGIGIPKDERNDIFTKFFRGNNAISLRPDGTGLGLYYARLLAEKQGGSIHFEPRNGGGTIFSILLPKSENTNNTII
jgi:signal transduction histidine kinase